MGIFNKLFRKDSDHLKRKAKSLLSTSQVTPIQMASILIQTCPVKARHYFQDMEEWNFIVAVACFFSAWNGLRSTRAQQRLGPLAEELSEIAIAELSNWDEILALDVFLDCQKCVISNASRLDAEGHQKEYILPSALGLWIVKSLSGDEPSNLDEKTFAHSAGMFVFMEYKDYWFK